MKKLVLFFALLAGHCILSAQINRAGKLFSYMPAPGQFINNPLVGTPDAALRIIDSGNYMVSLGAFGGSIVLGFDRPVRNNPANPYGIDFTIFGNAFAGSSEPGIIWVMKDENGNGLPDDTWYQIAGVSYFHPNTVHNYSVTWHQQSDGSARWTDNLGNSGRVLKNEFHSQPYYPSGQYFKGFPHDSVTYTGTLLVHPASVINGQIVLPSLAFGYADNRPVNRSVSPDIPDNPYTPDITEGAGGDPVDISWAVDHEGNYVNLDEIHFVKIVTGALSDLGVLGEISTEIVTVVAASPSAVTGPENITVIHPHPPYLLLNDTLKLHADFFIKGRRIQTKFVFENSDRTIADISGEGTIIAKDGGTIRVSVTPEGFPEHEASAGLLVRKPVSVSLSGISSQMVSGESALIYPVLSDQNGSKIDGMEWIIDVEDIDIINVSKANGGITLHAVKPGSTRITVYTTRYPDINESAVISVMPDPGPVRVYATAKTDDYNLFPRQWISISPFSVNRAVESRTKDYSNPEFVSVAQVIMSVLENADVSFNFRDDAASGNALYLYSVESEGLYTYGWGGKTAPAAFARVWMVRHRGNNFYKNLDAIRVSDLDTIEIYHVPNILDKWVVSRLFAYPDSAATGDRISLYRQSVECVLHSDGSVTEKPAVPLRNQPVFAANNERNATNTDADGFAGIEVEGSGPWIIQSGNDAVFIRNKITTGLSADKRPGPMLYPNPVKDFLHIKGQQITLLQILDATGRTVHIQYPLEGNLAIAVRDFNPGIYVVVTEDNGIVYRNKIVKH